MIFSNRRGTRCTSAGRVTARAFLSVVALASCLLHPAVGAPAEDAHADIVLPPEASPQPTYEHEFTLRHIYHHGTYLHPSLHRKLDVKQGWQIWEYADDDQPLQSKTPTFKVRSNPLAIQRLKDRTFDRIEALQAEGRNQGVPVDLPASDWTVDTVKGPNVTDKETVIAFARMAANAYVLEPGTGEWEEISGRFNYTEDFGWEGDGLRGHIFADTKNRTVVIGLKGTSAAVFDGSETTTNDKENDNLFFSCCCGEGKLMWRKVCDCQTSTFSCNATCVTHNLNKKNRYYSAAQALYHNVTATYPDADVWLTGHSLGGSVCSLLGLTYGLPVITFEAVPEALPASRLGLPTPPKYRAGDTDEKASTGAFHFGHTADPVYVGSCNTVTSVCTIGGYAMESICHTGSRCVYDTVKDKGWGQSMWYHKIVTVLHDVLQEYDDVPECKKVEECTDCFAWKFFKSNRSSTTTSLTSTSTVESFTRTRTETCQTPGWWGCLDETTSHGPTATATSASSTTTCHTPGWFGCLDPITTTTSSNTKTTPEATPTSICHTPGWFWCKDKPTASSSGRITPAPTSAPSRPTATATSTSSTCRHPGFFWGCWDMPTGSSFDRENL